MFAAFTWGFESMEVVAMLRLVGEKTRQQRQTKRRSSETPIAQANEWGGRWGNKEGDKAAAADKTPITADKRGDKEGRKERKKDRGESICMMR